MKRFILLIGVCIALASHAQHYMGKVVDEAQLPVAYANVILQQKADSAFIEGCVTDANGTFQLKAADGNVAKQLKISYIGYVTAFVNVSNGYKGLIELKSEAQHLREVVVKGHKPVFEMKSGILTTQIKGSILSNLGTASEVLKQLPFVSGRENVIEIFGRGTPLIYLNNRLVKNNNELSQLKSDHIKDIQIIMNPGSQYDAETDAVIKITTLKPIGDGIGGSLSLRGKQKKEFVHDEQIDLNYRKGGMDFFAMAYYAKDKRKQEQRDHTSFVHHAQSYRVNKEGKLIIPNELLEMSGGMNYSIDARQSLGVRYTYQKNFDSPVSFSFLNRYEEGKNASSFRATNDIRQGGSSHYVNAYYQKKIDRLSFNIDGTFMDKSNFMNATAWNDKDQLETTIPSESASKSRLYALKAWGVVPLANGTLEVGVEGTQSNNEQYYLMNNKDWEDDLPSNLSESNQKAITGYLSYSKKWDNFSLNAGLRYEYVDYVYSVDGVKRDEQSKKYNNLFPSLSLSYQKDQLSMSVSYRTAVRRPGYWQLRSNIAYNDNFSYEGGNPSLQRAIYHNCGILLRYGDFLLDCTYSYKKDDIMFYIQHYKDKPVIFYSFMNHDRQSFTARLAFAPTISVWKPSFSSGVSLQELHYAGMNYNTPAFVYSWKNLISLPRKWTIGLNIEGRSYGHGQLTANYSSLDSDFSVSKSFKNFLSVYVGATDLFNTYRERWMMNVDDIRFKKWNSVDYRCVYVRVMIRFNKASNKYKGGSSGQSERSRL